MDLKRLAALLAAGTLALGAAACGDDDDGGDGGGGAPAATAPAGTQEEAPSGGDTAAEGRSVFTERCSSCHTLADADATGQVGPNLDRIAADVDAVKKQVEDGGGAMPPFRDSLTAEQIQAVSEYVVQARSGR